MVLLVLAVVLLTFNVVFADETGIVDGTCGDGVNCRLACYRLFEETWKGYQFYYDCEDCWNKPWDPIEVLPKSGQIKIAALVLPHVNVDLNYDRMGWTICNTDGANWWPNWNDDGWLPGYNPIPTPFKFKISSNVPDLAIKLEGVDHLKNDSGYLETKWQYSIFDCGEIFWIWSGWILAPNMNQRFTVGSCFKEFWLNMKFKVPIHQAVGLYENTFTFTVCFDPVDYNLPAVFPNQEGGIAPINL